VTDPGLAAYQARFDLLRAAPRTNFTLVIIDKNTDQIVGVGSVFIEHKFLRGLGSVGHIEDIAVDSKVQGKKLGLRIIQALTGISEREGCYKTILNCSDKNIRECFISSISPRCSTWLTGFVRSLLREVRLCKEGERNGERRITCPPLCHHAADDPHLGQV
jgi:hypothetical protein